MAQKLPNAFGLYDMLGNGWQWTAEGGGVSGWPVDSLRGGSWDSELRQIRVSLRAGIGVMVNTIGFRCVL